jgi:exodeoxyribonuclease V alpha subunit
MPRTRANAQDLTGGGIRVREWCGRPGFTSVSARATSRSFRRLTKPAGSSIMDIVARRIPGRFGMDPCRDVQVLAPKRRYGGRVFRVGDKVRNYGITTTGVAGVFNGTVGVVTGMSLEDGKLTVLTDEDESIGYAFDELDELAHAYAVTIHRSRGSEYPAVVIPLTPGSWMMLQRNLLYTAITRAKRWLS